MSPASGNDQPEQDRTSSWAEETLKLASPAAARLWASKVIGGLRAEAWATDQDPDFLVGVLKESIAGIGGLPGASAALALSLAGDPARRIEFAELGADLAVAADMRPSWFAGERRMTLLGAQSILRDHGDVEVFLLEYVDHLIVVTVDHTGLYQLLNATVTAPVPSSVAAVYARALAAAVAPAAAVTPLSATEVAQRLAGPVIEFVKQGPQFPTDVPGGPDPEELVEASALLQAVVAELPWTEPDADAVIEQFLAGDVPAGKWPRWWARLVTDDALARGRAATSFSQTYAHQLVLNRLLLEVAVPEDDVPALSEAIRAWARFVHIDWADRLPALLDKYATLNARLATT